jgi:transcriptional regulator with XRE-family HTH domain
MATTRTTNITKRIESRRLELGLSQMKLSDLTGIPVVTLQRRLKHDDKLTIPELDKLSDAFGVPASFWETSDITPAADLPSESSAVA